MERKRRINLRVLLMCMACLAVLTAGALYAQAAGSRTVKSISIRIGKKDVTKRTYRMKTGKTKNFKVMIQPSDIKDKIRCQSDRPEVVSVNNRGKLTAKRSGNAKVTVTVNHRGKKKSTWMKIRVTGSSMEKQENQPSGGDEKLSDDQNTETAGKPVVYMTRNIDSAGLMKVYQSLQWAPSGRTAVKLSTGEPPASNYLDPDLIRELVQSVDGTIVECNTAYGGSRASTAMHMQVAKDHGFTEIADVDIQDADGSMEIPVKNGSRLSVNYVGKNFGHYDSYLVLSHFKGHSMAGFGGAVKNISIGLASSEGKCWIHSGGTSRTNAWGGKQNDFLESMAEAGKAVSDYLGNGKRIMYINVMNRLSVDCDCDGHPAEPDMHDIGILASEDPVALDQACVDLIYEQKNGDGASLVNRIESRNGLLTLEHAQEIGLGSRVYTLVDIDR